MPSFSSSSDFSRESPVSSLQPKSSVSLSCVVSTFHKLKRSSYGPSTGTFLPFSRGGSSTDASLLHLISPTEASERASSKSMRSPPSIVWSKRQKASSPRQSENSSRSTSSINLLRSSLKNLVWSWKSASLWPETFRTSKGSRLRKTALVKEKCKH